jgi:hypothetical protein
VRKKFCFNHFLALTAESVFGTYVHEMVIPLVDYFEQFGLTLAGHFLELKNQISSMMGPSVGSKEPRMLSLVGRGRGSREPVGGRDLARGCKLSNIIYGVSERREERAHLPF